MDLTKFLGQDTQEPSAQRLSKEEYAAQKKQEREEIWGMIDGKAQEVFQNGDSLKGFWERGHYRRVAGLPPLTDVLRVFLITTRSPSSALWLVTCIIIPRP